MAETLDALHEELVTGRAALPPDYVAKQIHKVPDAKVVKRREFVLDLCRGKSILDVGASGPMSDALREVAAHYVGLDREAREGVEAVDLDAYDGTLPAIDNLELVFLGEVLEHLSNPGWLLDRLRRTYLAPLLITVPNAFSGIGVKSLTGGVENVNREHVAYYSYQTLKTLLERHGYQLKHFCWYNGQPRFAEGLIVFTE